MRTIRDTVNYRRFRQSDTGCTLIALDFGSKRKAIGAGSRGVGYAGPSQSLDADDRDAILARAVLDGRISSDLDSLDFDFDEPTR